MAAERIKDMTKGRPAGLILGFALPLMLGNVFQQLYTLVDAMVVGHFVGVEALAALGAADWLNWMVLGIITGLTQGFGILMSQRFGASDLEGLRKTIAMSGLLSALAAGILLALSLSLARPLLLLLNTPANILADALTYLSICFCGIPVITAFNAFSTTLRALGDSRTPLYAMVIAALVNVGLDLLFVCVFGWGVAGAAIATVLAQGFSGVYCLLSLRRLSILRFRQEDWKRDLPLCGQLLRLGFPTAFQNAIIAVGGLVVQFVINGFGFIFVAGFTATNKLYGLLELAATAFGFSMATFTGQNLGARQYARIRSGMRAALVMAVATAAVIGACMLLFGRSILSAFISGTPEETVQVLDVAYTYLSFMSYPLPILYLLHLYRCALQGMGDTVIPMWSGILELVMRISIALLLPQWIGQQGIYFAEVTAWLGAELILMFTYYARMRRLLRGAWQPA